MKKTLAMVLAGALVLALCACSTEKPAEPTPQETESAAAETEPTSVAGPIASLTAGAGVGTINFPDAMFPMSEGFDGVDQAPHVRVLLLQNDIKVAVVAMELVNTPADCIEAIQNKISEATGTLPGNVLVSSSHAFCTPHAPTEADQVALFNEAVLAAADEAIEAAVADLQPAFVGVETTECDANVNNQAFDGEKWIDNVPSPDRISDKTLTVFKVSTPEGEPISIMWSYGVRSACADAPRGTETGRKITPDLTGEACIDIEEKYGVPALYLNSAAADQMPVKVALWSKVTPGVTGSEQVWDGIDAGLQIAKEMGETLSGAVISVVDGLTCDGEGIIGRNTGAFDWDNNTEDAQINIPVEVLVIDDFAIAAVKTELCSETAIELREASSFGTTLALTFVNGDQSYMPSASTYDEGAKVAGKSSLKKGAAEEFVKVAVDLMNGDLETTNVEKEKSEDEQVVFEGTDADSVGRIVNIGGKEWQVLAEVDGKQLIITKDVICVGAFNEAGGQVKWEESSVRSYLNGEFFNTLSSDEQAKVQETVCANKANSTYAAGAGADTTDKVFLLSAEEAEGYFADNAARVANDPESGKTTTWWLRTTGKDLAFAATILTDGSYYAHGNLCGEADASQAGDTYEPSGVRPAMWISK